MLTVCLPLRAAGRADAEYELLFFTSDGEGEQKFFARVVAANSELNGYFSITLFLVSSFFKFGAKE